MKVIALLVVLAVFACAPPTSGNDGVAEDSADARMRAQYDRLVNQIGCSKTTLDREWQARRDVLVDRGASPCLALGRFGIPTDVRQSNQSDGETIQVEWARAPRTAKATFKRPFGAGGQWEVAGMSY